MGGLGGDPDGRWKVGADRTLTDVVALLRGQAARTSAVLAEPRGHWRRLPTGGSGETSRRAAVDLLPRVEEYARHAGHLDVVVELAGGPTGE